MFHKFVVNCLLVFSLYKPDIELPSNSSAGGGADLGYLFYCAHTKSQIPFHYKLKGAYKFLQLVQIVQVTINGHSTRIHGV